MGFGVLMSHSRSERPQSGYRGDRRAVELGVGPDGEPPARAERDYGSAEERRVALVSLPAEGGVAPEFSADGDDGQIIKLRTFADIPW